MKNLTVLVLLTLGSFSITKAQDVDYRFTAGVNFAFVEETPQLTDASTSFGYMLGVAADIGGRLFLEPSTQYASYGSTVTLNDATDSKHSMRLGYIRVPVQAGLRLFESSSMIPFNLEARAGLSESFLVGFSDHVQSGNTQALGKDDIAGARTAAIIGAGVRLLFFSIDLEYELGLTNTLVNGQSSKLNALYVIFGGNF